MKRGWVGFWLAALVTLRLCWVLDLHGESLASIEPISIQAVPRQTREAFSCELDAGSATSSAACEALYREAERCSRIDDPKQRQRAIELFQSVSGHACAEETDFGTRARLEVARLELKTAECRRNQPDFLVSARVARGRAREIYAEVSRDIAVEPKYRERALLALAKLSLASSEWEQAREAYQHLAKHSRDPLKRIAGYNGWACTYLAEDDLEAAAGVLFELQSALQPWLAARTDTGKQVRSAVQRMRAQKQLRQRVQLRFDRLSR